MKLTWITLWNRALDAQNYALVVPDFYLDNSILTNDDKFKTNNFYLFNLKGGGGCKMFIFTWETQLRPGRYQHMYHTIPHPPSYR